MKSTLRILILLLLVIINFQSFAQKAENLILLTTDGLRWQEVFGGIDTMIASDKQFTRDKSGLMKKYYDPDINIRRKKLMPFFWSKIATGGKGTIWMSKTIIGLAIQVTMKCLQAMPIVW